MIRINFSKILPVLLFLCGVSFVRSADTNSAETKPAVRAMESWIKLLDDEAYSDSWTKASKRFQTSLTSAQWVEAASKVRIPLGAVKSRKLDSAVYRTDIPLPDGSVLKGDFVIAQFHTSFANMAAATETVSFEKEPDGSWKASGYYIKPRM